MDRGLKIDNKYLIVNTDFKKYKKFTRNLVKKLETSTEVSH